MRRAEADAVAWFRAGQAWEGLDPEPRALGMWWTAHTSQGGQLGNPRARRCFDASVEPVEVGRRLPRHSCRAGAPHLGGPDRPVRLHLRQGWKWREKIVG